MKLWTFHKPEFPITSGSPDISKSGYLESVKGLQSAYDELARRLGLPKYEIVWCHVRDDDLHRKYYDKHIEYQLDVPDGRILAKVDSFIWSKILGEKTYPNSLRIEAQRNAPENISSICDYVAQQIELYHAQQPPEGGWWSKLFITDLDAEGACVLLRHPVPESWITNKISPPGIQTG